VNLSRASFGNQDARKLAKGEQRYLSYAARLAVLIERNRHRGIVSMVFEEYDFTRNPIVENQTFFLESKCIHCGVAVLGYSLEELLEKEMSHRAQCTWMRAA
jgi:hypothetical protein